MARVFGPGGLIEKCMPGGYEHRRSQLCMAELVEEGVTGLLFHPGDAGDLADKLAWARNNPQLMRRMGLAAGRLDCRFDRLRRGL